MEKIDRETVYSVTTRILYELSSDLNKSSIKALLANLRNSIGKNLSDTIEIWPLLFRNLPEEFLSEYGNESPYEKAILNTLQLYALHQQGNSDKVFEVNKEKQWENVGTSLSHLRIGDNIKAVDRRFNAMITSTDYEELIYHLRHMISLLKAKTQIKVNYARLAEDLYWFLVDDKEKVRLKWARKYYSYQYLKSKKGEKNNEKK